MVSLKIIIALSFFYHGEKMTVKYTIKIVLIRSVQSAPPAVAHVFKIQILVIKNI